MQTRHLQAPILYSGDGLRAAGLVFLHVEVCLPRCVHTMPYQTIYTMCPRFLSFVTANIPYLTVARKRVVRWRLRSRHGECRANRLHYCCGQGRPVGEDRGGEAEEGSVALLWEGALFPVACPKQPWGMTWRGFGVRYFGPFGSVKRIQSLLATEYLLQVFAKSP